MRVHQITEDGLIINTIEVDSIPPDSGLVDADIGGGIGDSVIGGMLIPKPLPAGPSYAEQKAVYLNEVRDLRARVLARLNGYGAALYLQDPPAQEEEKANCAMLIQGLLDITTNPAVIAATNLAELMAAVKTEYARLVSLASTELVKAFRQVDV